MAYKVSVYDNDEKIKGWWVRYRTSAELCRPTLAHYNCTDLVGTEYLLFDTEEDVTAFILAWS